MTQAACAEVTAAMSRGSRAPSFSRVQNVTLCSSSRTPPMGRWAPEVDGWKLREARWAL